MSPKAKRLARTLLRKNRGTRSQPGKSWRVIAREDYNGAIPAGTLCRIAVSKGEWLPKNEDALLLLGLKRERKPKAEKPFTPIAEMSVNALRKALKERKEIPPVIPAFIKEFKRLGWITKETRARTR